MKTLLETYDLKCNNKSGKTIRQTKGHATSIIYVTFTTLTLVVLDFCTIDEELTTLSDHELIVFNIANLYKAEGIMRMSREVTGWAIRATFGGRDSGLAESLARMQKEKGRNRDWR